VEVREKEKCSEGNHLHGGGGDEDKSGGVPKETRKGGEEMQNAVDNTGIAKKETIDGRGGDDGRSEDSPLIRQYR